MTHQPHEWDRTGNGNYRNWYRAYGKCYSSGERCRNSGGQIDSEHGGLGRRMRRQVNYATHRGEHAS